MMTPRWIALSAAFAMAAATFTISTSARAVVCSTDAECTATPNTPHCNNNVCAQCSNDSHCGGTTSRTPRCLTAYGICGCTQDAECGNETSGRVCTRPSPAEGSAPYCRAGCVNDGAGGRNGCPDVGGAACIGAAGEIGQCRHSCLNVPLLCSGAGPRNKCEVIGAEFARCVECQSNADCSTGAPVCDPGTQTCVQCRANNDCATSQNGPICRGGASSQASCGCNSDADCGTGRICHDTVKVCLAGCRGNSPGTCPPGTVCSASGGGTGQCVPGTDGGVDAGNDASTGDGGNGDAGEEDGGTGDAGEDSGNGDAGEEDGGTGDGGVEDGSTGDASTDGGADAADGSRPDAGDAGDAGSGNDAGNENDGNYMTSLEGGGCDCSVVPSEDSLPLGGLLAVGGFFAFFTRRRARSSKKDEGTKQP